MEVLGQFGINPILLAAQIVNFLIILYVVKRFALKPILQMLKNREKTIQEGYKQAEEARVLLESATEKEKAILRIAHKEAKQLIDEAKNHSEKLINESEAKTRQQTEKMIAEARAQIAFETKEVEKRLTLQVSELAVEFIQKSLGDVFTGEEQNIVVNKAIKNLKKRAN